MINWKADKMENFLSKYRCLFSMANEGQVQVGKPESLPWEQCNMQNN